MIADEPTTALDVTIQAQILRSTRQPSEANATAWPLLLITHDLGVVAETCDRVVIMYAGQIVETGAVQDVFRDPRHPYTRGLLASLPDAVRQGRRLTPIPGVVPPSTRWPDGCRFHDRCPSAMQRCAAEAPPLLDKPAGQVRCWLEEGTG